MTRTRTIYVLHFDPPYVAPIAGTDRVKTAQHYIGSTAGSIEDRYRAHIAGQGSPLVRAAFLAGSSITVAATFPGDKKAERRMKRWHHHRLFCPICTERPRTSAPEPRP